jgi:hypothetical protein
VSPLHRKEAAMTETQGWFLIVEVAVLALAALRGLIGR